MSAPTLDRVEAPEREDELQLGRVDLEQDRSLPNEDRWDASDRVPPRPPRREEPHGRRRPDRPPRWIRLLVIAAILGIGLVLSMLGSLALQRFMEEPHGLQ